ncbi:Molybdopterin biosynthesis enzyme MoeA [Ignavibacterium album JCM 16511]|uniref:Molybdopterin molybdenumtransferase n=1 Tax=Ignavibacterium album (strain DSM 19864 / JCM 16511 / NBRC 101810 / Mat9-16) TaxID=945713 RepID=I0ANF2_IGNAJ|nr:gephyrin-like molybdotransferase Glp [Ignavibacterium album]AFH50509.1 Molybdopterin biosynthesis enzyme MoeA [Ignavibacterium album JCM 16511]
MINYNEALEIIKHEIEKLTLHTEDIDILESYNRILAEDVVADVDLPPFDNSAVDGYVIKYSDRKEWKIIGEISAGNFSSFNLTENDAVLITTGSKLPSNADTVIPIEDVEVNSDLLKLKENVFFKKGMNIRTLGNDLKKNEIAVHRYTKNDAKTIAVLASCGKEKVKVFSKLKAAILATGDELIPINEKPAGDKLRVSNIYSLYAAIKEINHTVINLGFTKDDKEIITQKVKAALEMDIDLFITTGGVSVGKYDFLKDIFEEQGVKQKFWKVNIKPGKPIYFGVYEKDEKRILVFGLPGNPVSSLVNFYVFIKPAIEFLFKQDEIKNITATLQNDLKKKDGKRHFSRGILFEEKGEWKVTSEFSQSSGNLVEMSRANCLIEIEEERVNPKKGERLKCILI